MTHDKSLLPKMRPCLIMMNYEPKTKTENRKQKTKTEKRKTKTMTVTCGKSPFPGSRACGKSPFPGNRTVTLNEKRKPFNLTSLRTLSKPRGTIWEPSRKTVACRKSPFPGSRVVTLNEKRKPVNLTSLRMLSKPRGMIWEPLRKPPRPSTTLNIKTFETAIDVPTPVVKIEQTDDIATPTPNPSNEQTKRKYKEQK